MTAEIAVHGRTGTAKIRGRVIAGFERGGALRLEAPAPFGAPIFVMAARANRATLWLPRGRQVVRDAPVEDVLEAITGLRRSSDDVLALLAGCLADGTIAGSGTGGGRNARGWLTVELGDAMRAFLKQDGAVWRVVAGQRGASGGPVAWRVSYADFVAGFPGTISVWQEFVTAGGASDASSLAFEVSQLEANVPIDPAAFEVAVPPDAQPLTVDELRQAGPLADRDAGRWSGR